MNKQKSYHHPPTNPNFFSHTNYFFSVQLGHPKLSGYGLLSTQALQNRSQKYSSVSQSGATAFPWRDPGPPAASGGKGVNGHNSKTAGLENWGKWGQTQLDETNIFA